MAGTSGNSGKGKQDSSSSFYVSYTSLGTDIDIVAASLGGADATKGTPQACRRIRIAGAAGGSLVLTMPNGTNCTIANLNPGDNLDVEAIGIVASGTTVTALTVFY